VAAIEVVVVAATVLGVVLAIVVLVLVVVDPDPTSPAQATARTLITMNSGIRRDLIASSTTIRGGGFRQVPVKPGFRFSKKAVMASVRSLEMR
jgi:hypothetical protein